MGYRLIILRIADVRSDRFPEIVPQNLAIAPHLKIEAIAEEKSTDSFCD
ncbi:hypothetical protein [Lyngbya sp. PCC 8106]|nr:hypothetical protein [Lyngbya sp. PCC 8106]